jgi:hypothetical protein
MSWTAPKVDWEPSTAISNTLLNDIGNNLIDLDYRVGGTIIRIGTILAFNTSDIPAPGAFIYMYQKLTYTDTTLPAWAIPAWVNILIKATNFLGLGTQRLRTAALPAEIRPVNNISLPACVISNSIDFAGLVTIDTNGYMEFFTAPGVGVSSGGQNGVGNCVLSYPIFS